MDHKTESINQRDFNICLPVKETLVSNSDKSVNELFIDERQADIKKNNHLLQTKTHEHPSLFQQLSKRTEESTLENGPNRMATREQDQDQLIEENDDPEMPMVEQQPLEDASTNSDTSLDHPSFITNQSQNEHIENAVQENLINEENFGSGLEFILTKTPFINVFMCLIHLALASGASLLFVEGKNSHHYLSMIAFIFLFYLFLERLLKMFKDCPPNRLSYSNISKIESFYNVLDIITFIFLILVTDLKISGILKSMGIGLDAFIVNFAFYCFSSKLSKQQKFWGVLKRGFFVVQLLLITEKINGSLNFSWKIILSPGWVLLGGLWLKVWDYISKILTGFTGNSVLSTLNKKSKAIGVLALGFILADIIVLMMILVGVTIMLDEEPSSQFIKTWLTVSQYLNAVILFYCTITGPDLIEFIVCVTEYFNGTPKEVTLSRSLVRCEKEVCVLRVSPTYYKVLNGKSHQEETQTEGDKEDNICYICCSKDANGVIVDCGHGGVCFECLNDFLNKKDECMECRKKVETILKIETDQNGSVFQSKESFKLVTIMDEQSC